MKAQGQQWAVMMLHTEEIAVAVTLRVIVNTIVTSAHLLSRKHIHSRRAGRASAAAVASLAVSARRRCRNSASQFLLCRNLIARMQLHFTVVRLITSPLRRTLVHIQLRLWMLGGSRRGLLDTAH